MTQEGVQRTLEERSTWLWSRSRERFWLAGRDGGGYDVQEMRSNCMGDSLLAVVDAEGKGVCHLGYRSCFLARSIRRSAGDLVRGLERGHGERHCLSWI